MHITTSSAEKRKGDEEFDVSASKSALAQYIIACLVLYLTALNYMR